MRSVEPGAKCCPTLTHACGACTIDLPCVWVHASQFCEFRAKQRSTIRSHEQRDHPDGVLVTVAVAAAVEVAAGGGDEGDVDAPVQGAGGSLRSGPGCALVEVDSETAV